MVKKLIALLGREWANLHEAAILLGGFALLSQILALVRDRLLTHSFGAGQVLDIYYAAFRIPDFIFVGVASFMSAMVLIPLLGKYAEHSDLRAQKFLNDVFTVFFTLLVIVTIGVFFAVPLLVHALFPAFSDVLRAELIAMTRILLLSPILLGLSNLLGSVGQMLNKFFAFALAPLLYNIGIIIGILFLYPVVGIYGLGWGVVLGAFLHFFVHFFVSSRNGFVITMSWRISFRDIAEVVRVSFPRTLGLVANQIALLVLTVFAAQMEEGSIAIFMLAFNLQSVPLAIIGTSYATAAFPSLSKHFNGDDIVRFLAQILSAARHIIFWSIPILVLFVVLRAHIVRIVLGSGSFDWNATKLTAAALALFILSLVAQSLCLLFTRGFYATGRSGIPLLANMSSALLILVLGYFLSMLFVGSAVFKDFIETLFRVEGISGTQVLMLPLAYTLGSIFNAVLLVYMFRRKFGKFLTPVKDTIVHGLFASLVAGFVAYEFLQVLGTYVSLTTFWGLFTQAFVAGIAGVLSWWIVLELLGNKEIREIRESVHRKFWRARVVIPDKEEL